MFFQNKLVHLQNTMNDKISHSGIIDSITGTKVHVRIVQSSACSSCKVASYCSSAESKEKMIDVRCLDARKYKVGQAVNVLASQSVGMKAVVLAFVVPTLVLLATIIVCVNYGISDGIAALAGIGSLIPYYMVLYLFRGKIENIVTFYLEPANETSITK